MPIDEVMARRPEEALLGGLREEYHDAADRTTEFRRQLEVLKVAGRLPAPWVRAS